MATEQQLKTLSGFNLRSQNALKIINSRLRAIALLQEEFAKLRLAGDASSSADESAQITWQIKLGLDNLDQLIDGNDQTPSLTNLQDALTAEIVSLRTPDTELNDAYLAVKNTSDPNPPPEAE